MSSRSHLTAEDLLRDQARALNSAMLVAMNAAERVPVHRLRTGTRRLEAQLALLALLPGLPEHAREAAAVDRLLRHVRRAAAAVRDLDVQAEMIEADLPDDAAVSEGSRGYEARLQGQRLIAKLQRRRVDEASELVDTLRAEAEPLAEAIRTLEASLSPQKEAVQEADRSVEPIARRRHRAVPVTFTPVEISQRIGEWFAVRGSEALQTAQRGRKRVLRRLQHLNEDTLHTLRKAAKQCRYMAESLPEGSPVSRRLAARFEYLQEAGGRWHDWLLLEALAARVHGKKAALTERYRNHRDAALAEYHLQLAMEFTTGAHRLHSRKRG